MFTKEQKQTAYQKLSPEAQDFVMANETAEITQSLLQQIGLTGELFNLADSEILYAMLGLQTLQNAIENISKISGKSISDLSNLQQDLEENIFSKLSQSSPEFRVIPSTLQSFIETGEWKQKVAKIGREFQLNEDQINKLEAQTLSVLNCIEIPSAFKENIKTELSIDENLSRRVTDAMNGSVFALVMKEIKNAWAPEGKMPEEEQEERENKGVNKEAEIKEAEPIEEIDYDFMKKAMQPAVPKAVDQYRESLE